MRSGEVGSGEVEKWKDKKDSVLRMITTKDRVLRTINNKNLELEINGAKL